jgi:hypothetical protein
MAIVKNSARKLRDCGLNLFGGWYAVTRFTSTIILIFR